MITIRRAEMDDIPNIMRFIDEHWKKGHILARDREFFEWQFVDDEEVNVYIGVDVENGVIYGMEGTIRYNRTDNPDVSGSVWKTIRSENAFLGTEIEEYLVKDLNVRYGCSAGMSRRALKIYQALGYNTCSMDHYYRLGDWSEYHIAKVKHKMIPPHGVGQYDLEPFDSLEEMKKIISETDLKNGVMSKDYYYIEKRYFRHPIYRYEFWKVVNECGISNSVIVTRDEWVENNRVCKIVDFYGCVEDLSHITGAIDKLIQERRYEYVDIYSFGVSVDIYERAGFVRCDSDHVNIIPNYFHPFEQRNVELMLVDPMAEGLRLFRGDGDQDRPN